IPHRQQNQRVLAIWTRYPDHGCYWADQSGDTPKISLDDFRPDQGKRPSARSLPVIGHEGPLRLSPTWSLTPQPCSPKRLGHSAAVSGHAIASAWPLGRSEAFL